MKSKPIGALLGVLTLLAILAIAPSAFADATVSVENTNNMEEMSTDGTTKVSINTTPTTPTSGQPLTISLTFTDSNGNYIHHQNYALTVTQHGSNILGNVTGHTHTGIDVQTTDALESSDPVDIQITLKGIGLPNTDPSTWTGPKGDMITFHVVPEFGPIAPIVLAIAVLSIVVFAAKSRVIPKL